MISNLLMGQASPQAAKGNTTGLSASTSKEDGAAFSQFIDDASDASPKQANSDATSHLEVQQKSLDEPSQPMVNKASLAVEQADGEENSDGEGWNLELQSLLNLFSGSDTSDEAVADSESELVVDEDGLLQDDATLDEPSTDLEFELGSLKPDFLQTPITASTDNGKQAPLDVLSKGDTLSEEELLSGDALAIDEAELDTNENELAEIEMALQAPPLASNTEDSSGDEATLSETEETDALDTTMKGVPLTDAEQVDSNGEPKGGEATEGDEPSQEAKPVNVAPTAVAANDATVTQQENADDGDDPLASVRTQTQAVAASTSDSATQAHAEKEGRDKVAQAAQDKILQADVTDEHESTGVEEEHELSQKQKDLLAAKELAAQGKHESNDIGRSELKAVAQGMQLGGTESQSNTHEATRSFADVQATQLHQAGRPHAQMAAQPLDVREQIQQKLEMQQEKVAPALGQRLMMMVNNKLQTAEIKLDPPELGSMMVRIQVHNDQAQLHVVAQQPHTREMLEQAMPRLRELMQEQGLQLTDAQVGRQDQQENGSANSQGNQGNSGVEQGMNDESSMAVEQANDTRYFETRSGIDYYA